VSTFSICFMASEMYYHHTELRPIRLHESKRWGGQAIWSFHDSGTSIAVTFSTDSVVDFFQPPGAPNRFEISRSKCQHRHLHTLIVWFYTGAQLL
jgi:hypothetical protein